MQEQDRLKVIHSELQKQATALEFPYNFRLSMLAASQMVDQAAEYLGIEKPGTPVAELLFFAARLEELASSRDG